MQHTLIAVFDNRADAEHAMDELLASGFSRQDVKISKGDPTGITDSVTGRSASATTDTDTGQDEGFGASIRHFFSDIFGTDNSTHAQKYSDAVSRGHHVLTLTTESEPEVERAADIVERHGPVDIDEKHAEWAGGAGIANPESMRMSGAGGMQQSAGMSQQSASMSQDLSDDRNLYQQQSLNTAEPMGTTYQEPQGASLQGSSLEGSAIQGGSVSGSQQRDINRDKSLAGSGLTGSSSSQQRDTSLQGSALTGSQQRDTAVSRDTETSRAIPVVEEQLKVGKREVQRGGVRIYSRLVETPVNESIGLREEHVNVQRRPVDQPISPSDASAFKEQSFEMRETAEEAVVQKTARVVEEVRVGKEVSERTEQINDTVRRTEVEVEQLGSRSGMSDEDYYRQHWTSNFGSSGGRYEDYQPAYSYGSEMARNDKYRGRKWDEVESDLRSDWDSRSGSSGGASTWEKMKAAVRHGWDRMTGDSDSDSYYRGHWDSNYSTQGGKYDDYEPAYRYGTESRSKYQGRDWDDVESDMRSDWDSRYGSSGGSTWEKTKDAVRHGWNKMTGDSSTDNDDYYRNHWSSNYAATGSSYDDYAPAYRYGTEMRSNSRYANRQWDEVEPELRSDWDTRYGSSSGSTWEKMKAAVRHGWDRMTS